MVVDYQLASFFSLFSVSSWWTLLSLISLFSFVIIIINIVIIDLFPKTWASSLPFITIINIIYIYIYNVTWFIPITCVFVTGVSSYHFQTHGIFFTPRSLESWPAFSKRHPHPAFFSREVVVGPENGRRKTMMVFFPYWAAGKKKKCLNL